MTPVRSSTTDNKTRSICIVDERGGENREREGEKKKENNVEGIIERIYVQNEKLEIEIHYRLVRGVNENTADLCRGAKE